MAIYRPQRPRWIPAVITGMVGLLVGLLVGWGLLRPDPNPVEVLEEVRATLLSAAGSLEVVEIEYAESVEDGEIVAPSEFEGARDALASSRERYLEVRETVAALSPNAASAIDEAYEGLKGLVERQAPSEDVAELARELADMLMGALGG